MNKLTDRLVLRTGTLADYAALAEFHYRDRKPATVSRVLVLEDTAPSIAQRFEAMHGVEAGRAADAPKCGGAIAAVLVESLPVLNCALRELALRDRYRALGRAAAARLLNEEMRTISRVIVHPQWRGAALAVRLVRAAIETMSTPYLEALAAMGRVHPFFEQAGMTAYRRHAHRADQRLIDALRFAGIEPWELASQRRIAEKLAHSGVVTSGVVRRELQRWAGRGLTFTEQLEEARTRLLAEPVYYLTQRK